VNSFSFTLSGDRPEVETSLRGGAIFVRSRRGVRATERLLIEALPKALPPRMLAGFDAEGLTAMAAASLAPASTVAWTHVDAYVARKVVQVLRRNRLDGRVVHGVAPDLPGFTGRGAPSTEPFDLVLLPFPAGGESLVARELVEEAHDVLAPGGLLLAATDRSSTWLRDLVREIFGKADLNAGERGGAVVRGIRTKTTAAWKEHAHVLHIEVPGRTLEIETRPGTFSYGRLDRGTKALLGTLSEGLPRGAAVLDLGCGAGALGLGALSAALLHGRGARAVLVDSNARATDLAERNARRNRLDAAEVLLRADLEDLPSRAFDLVLANPPYFADFRIAESFMRAARGALKPGGEIRLVAKAAAKHAEYLRAVFGRAAYDRVGDYGIVRATA
jgi:16S rRNA (guanine1207-N2)-methyltransferase